MDVPLQKLEEFLEYLNKEKYPHEFNRRENLRYVGKYPAKSFYKPKCFSNDKKNQIREMVWKGERLWVWLSKRFEWILLKWSEGYLQFSRLNREGSKLDENDEGLTLFKII